MGGSFGVGWILLQEFRAFGNKGHTSDGQVINRAYDLGCEWATLEQCKWGSANDHTTWWKKVALVGYGQNWSSKGTKMVQGFCVQVSMWGDFEQGNKVWLNIKIGIGHYKVWARSSWAHMHAHSKCWKKIPNNYKLKY